MKTKTIFLSAILLLNICLFVQAQSNTEIKALTVEANHSTLQFSIPIANGLTRVTGKFTDYTIDLNLVDNDLTQSSLSAIIQAKSINTGIEARDDHLRTADFFDVETYPEITFVSNAISAQGSNYKVDGVFSMHGVSKAMSFILEPKGSSGENTLGFSIRLSLNRIDYGIGADFKHTSMEDFLGENIDVEIDFWTKKKKKKE